MSPILGIDLGTTNSVVAYMDDGRPRVIPNVEHGLLTPSVVAFTRDKKTWVGALAKAQAGANPDNTIFSIKRHMGVSLRPAADKVVSSIKRRMGSGYVVEVNGRIYTPAQISAMVLGKVKADAEQFLGERIEKAVITVPAYFNDTQRRATKDAGTIAGLDVIRIINEPTAAALAYGLDVESVHTVLVWDLGGGTFDVSILELGNGVFEVKAVCGDTGLGGDDYDERLAGLLAERFGWKTRLNEDSAAQRMFAETAEQAKVKLSTASSVIVPAPAACYGPLPLRGRPSTTVSREEFEELTRDLTERMVAPTRQALNDAEIDPVQIDRVILVGGATRMPAVQRLAQEITGLRPYSHIDPDKVVALGAAIQAGVLSGRVTGVTLVDVNPLSLGIETQGGVFAKIIERNAPIPASRSQLFTNARDNQTSVNVHLLQGEREMAAYNISLGQFELTDIEPQPRGEARIEVSFDVDANGMAHVSAHDLQTGNQKRIRVDSAGRLSQENIQRMLAEAQGQAQSDRREKEEVIAAIRAENLIRAAAPLAEQSRACGTGPHIAQEELAAAQQAVSQVKVALADGRQKPIQVASARLEKALRHLDQALKANQSATGEIFRQDEPARSNDDQRQQIASTTQQ